MFKNYGSVLSFLRRFDSFSARVQFNILGNQEYTSILSGIIYFLYLVIVSAYVLYIFIGFLWRKNALDIHNSYC